MNGNKKLVVVLHLCKSLAKILTKMGWWYKKVKLSSCKSKLVLPNVGFESSMAKKWLQTLILMHAS
jgi:hypothetical protein